MPDGVFTGALQYLRGIALRSVKAMEEGSLMTTTTLVIVAIVVAVAAVALAWMCSNGDGGNTSALDSVPNINEPCRISNAHEG